MACRLETRDHADLIENPQEIVRRFERVADIRDMSRFQDALMTLFEDQVKKRQGSENMDARLTRLADELVSKTSWMPTETQFQRGRAAFLKELSRPENLSVADFARLAGKSRAQIYNDIHVKRYLALSRGGSRGTRLPDFQLRDEGQALAGSLLAKAKDIDAWTLYGLLTAPNDALNGNIPGHAVQRNNLDQIARLLLSQIGIKSEVQQLG
jgi:hypothetical protein